MFVRAAVSMSRPRRELLGCPIDAPAVIGHSTYRPPLSRISWSLEGLAVDHVNVLVGSSVM